MNFSFSNYTPLCTLLLVAGLSSVVGCGTRPDTAVAPESVDQATAESEPVEADAELDMLDMAELHSELSKPLAGTDAAGDQPITVWKPDVDRLVALGAPQSVEDYEISLPVDFRAVENPNSERFGELGIRIFQWMGPAEPGEPGPTFSITIHPAVSTPRDCKEALEGYLANMKRQWPQTNVESIERGNVGDMPGVRSQYETFPEPDLRIVGRTYFIQDGLRALMIDVKAVGEDADERLKLLDTAALTFKSKAG